MPVSFRDVTIDNFDECVRMTVREDQPFVAPNVYSIAQSKVESYWITKAVYQDDTMVGFVMYAFNYAQRDLYLCRFMIDQRYQHQGYGRGTLEMLKQMALADPGIDTITLSTNPKNAYGIKVYTTFGFVDTGVLDHGEEVFVLKLR